MKARPVASLASVGRVCSALVVVALAALTAAVFAGIVSCVVVSGDSMEPGLSQGDLVVLRRRDAYRVGEVVAFRVPAGEAGAGSVVIHRIRSVLPEGRYRLRGDNRDVDDVWAVPGDDVVGSRSLHWAGGGRFVIALRSPLFVGPLGGAVVFLVVLFRSPGPSRTGREPGSSAPSDASGTPSREAMPPHGTRPRRLSGHHPAPAPVRPVEVTLPSPAGRRYPPPAHREHQRARVPAAAAQAE